MKFSRLLVLSALWLVGLGANAADLIERTAPTNADVPQTAATFEAGKTYLLCNKGSQMFWTQGNAWGTRACVGPLENAIRVRLDAFEAPEGTTLQEATYLFNNYSCIRSASYSWHRAFFDSQTAVFTDLGSQKNFYWAVDDMGSKTYRLKAAQYNPDYKSDGTQFVGYDVNVVQDASNLYAELPNDLMWPVSPFLTEGEGMNLDWVFYDAAVFDVYDKAQELKKEIETAEEAGIDVSAAVAVYNNLNATIEQLEAAIQALKEAMAGGIAAGTPDNPSNATSLINNPNFDNASSAGWSGTGPNMTGSGAHGPANVPEHYNKTFDTYQDIADLPNGVYCLNLYTFHRGSYADFTTGTNQDAYPYLYTVGADSTTVLFNNAWSALNTEPMAGPTEWGVDASETTTSDNGVTYYIPNDPSAFRLYAEKGFYETTLFFEVLDGKVRIGVKKDKTATGTDWAVFDTFRLHYYGNEPGSYQKWAELSAPKVEYPEGTIYTQIYMDAFNEAVNNVKATNKAEALAAIENAKAKAAELQKNVALWKQYDKLVTDAYMEYTVDDKYSWLISTGILADYYEMDDNGQDGPGYETIIGEHSLTNAELEAEIAFVQGLIDAILEEYKNQVQPGDDVTHLLQNPDFEYGLSGGAAQGWTVDVTNNSAGGNITPGPLGSDLDQKMMDAIGKTNHCFESWHVWGFDVWQEVKNAPVGVYEIQVQGYVRCEGSGYTRGDLEGLPSVPIYLYLNNARTNFPDVFSEIVPNQDNLPVIEDWSWETVNGYQSPNSMGGASICFAWDMYKKSAYGLVAKPGDSMRIGVKGEMNDNWWCIWDNFHLVYQGFKPEVVEPALDEALKTLDLSQYMGKSVYAKAEELNKRAQEAKAAGDGREMFEVLNDVYDLSEEITASVALFKKLWDAAETTLGEAIDASPAASDVRNQAAALQGRILGGIENHEYDDADVEGLLNEIDEMITKLGIPAGGENATDANPADFTNTIKNPTYDENVNGWSGTAAAWGADMANAEIFNANFDYYQELKGLYAGTYQLSVQGFYRAGSATNDYSTWVENPELNNNSFLYASVINGTDTVTYSKALIRLAAEASSEAEVGEPSDGYVWAKERTSADAYDGMVVCNSMTTGGYEFENGKYANNVVTFKVTDGAKVRLGLKKNVNIDQNWTLWDNWKLTYFGKSSDKTVDGDPSGIENLSDQPMVNVEYFTLDGRKASMLQKGIMIQKMTLGNGAVIVRKVRK